MIGKATIIDGPYKGWPLFAAIYLSNGIMTPAQVKAALLDDIDKKHADLERQREVIKSLPDKIVIGE
jgi:hypothetical protein